MITFPFGPRSFSLSSTILGSSLWTSSSASGDWTITAVTCCMNQKQSRVARMSFPSASSLFSLSFSFFSSRVASRAGPWRSSWRRGRGAC